MWSHKSSLPTRDITPRQVFNNGLLPKNVSIQVYASNTQPGMLQKE